MKISRVALGLIAFLIIFLSFSLPVFAVDNVISPKKDIRIKSGLLSRDNTFKNINFEAKFNTNNDLVIIINYDNDGESDLNINGDDELFVVIKDKFGLNLPKKVLLNRVNVDQKVVFTNTIKLPWYYDMIYFKVYKQKWNDPEFLEKEENFIGKTNLCNAFNNIYHRNNVKRRIADKNGGEGSTVVISALTPNIHRLMSYRIDVGNPSSKIIAKIILPEEQEDLMPEKDKICIFYSRIIGHETDREFDIDRLSIFYIPATVTKFKVVMYRSFISDDSIVFESDFINIKT